MKKFVVVILAISVFLSANAQKNRFKPLETWPYLYEDFTPGKVLTHKGNTIEYDILNINIADGKVHYVQDGTIMQADMNTIAAIRIGQDIYYNKGGHVYKALSESAHGAVLLKTEVDLDELSKADIGYGKSSLASVTNVSAFVLPGGNNINKSLEDITNNRYSGKELPIKEKYYIMVDGTLIRAAKKDILDWSGNNKNTVKEYLKTNKIRWKDVFGLSKLADYLYEINNNR